MDHIGIDVHKRESQIYILAEEGEVVEQRIRTEPERFAAVLGARPRARMLIEASTDSEWVARCLVVDGQAGATTSEGGRATGTGQRLSQGPSPQAVCFTTLHREAVSFNRPYSDTGPPRSRCYSRWCGRRTAWFI